MRTISVFSGCGGMDIGAERAGAEILLANDILPEAAETYRGYFENGAEVFRECDIADLNASPKRSYPKADLVIGGYPCQSFTLGGHRDPQKDERTQLYRQFAQCVDAVNPKFFVAENVKGLRALASGVWFKQQVNLFKRLGKHGYNITWALIQAQDYGVPQKRKRILIFGVRRDLQAYYWFPMPTYGPAKSAAKNGLKPYTSHGDAIAGLPLWPTGEFYERPHDPEGHWAWYYMSRNRKARWDDPSFTIVANFRHVTLHPASSTMTLTWSNLEDGWKQRWDFSGEYEHTVGHPERPVLDEPRRLSWRESSLIQTFPKDFEPAGRLERKFEQIGNAVPPLLAETLIQPLISGAALFDRPPSEGEVHPWPT